jgi:hypothetical protein
MRRRVAVATALALATATAAPAAAAEPAGEQLTLRLPDVPGYAIERTGPDDTCSAPVFLGDVAREVRRLYRRHWRDGCNVLLDRVWSATDAPASPRRLQSVASVLSDPAAAAALLARPRKLASSLVPVPHDVWREEATTVAIGEETRLLRLRGAPVHYGERSGVAVLWRSGAVLALVLAVGADAEAVEQAALRLAAVQQARIATPTPLRPGDFDDLEVPLDDPRLGVPVWWVGRELDGGPRRPPVRLQPQEEELTRADRRQGLHAVLTYGPREEVTAFQLSLFDPAGAGQATPVRRELRRIRRDRCIRSEQVTLAEGGATLFARRRGCQTSAIAGPVAIARLPGVRVAVVPEHGCKGCTDVVTRYASEAGVRAVLRALRPRPVLGAQPPTT